MRYSCRSGDSWYKTSRKIGFKYSSTCHERTHSGPGKSVRTLQVAARHRDGWQAGDAKYNRPTPCNTTYYITTSAIPSKCTHCHNYVCYCSKPKINAT